MSQPAWQFPLINPRDEHPLAHYLHKVKEELEEFGTTQGLERDMECIDVLQSAETLIRKYFKGDMDRFNRAKKLVIEKNRIRGYYDK